MEDRGNFYGVLLIDDIVCCENGEQALQILQQYKPDLIFLDIKMPMMDGIEFLKALRQTYGEGIPVVVLTTSSHPDDLLQVAHLKANYYLIKPLTPEKLFKMEGRCL